MCVCSWCVLGVDLREFLVRKMKCGSVCEGLGPDMRARGRWERVRRVRVRVGFVLELAFSNKYLMLGIIHV